MRDTTSYCNNLNATEKPLSHFYRNQPREDVPSLRRLIVLLTVIFLIWLFWPLAQTSPDKAPGQFIDLADGTIHYDQAGVPNRTPVILLHGFGASSFSFRHNLAPLSQDYLVLAPDALGFGFSSKPTGADYSAQAEIKRLRSFMDTLNINKAVLIGNSMGGRNAILFALEYPERVSALVLINSAGHNSENRDSPLLRLPGVATLFLKISSSRPAVKAILRSLFYDNDKVTPEVVEGYRLPLRLPGTPSVLRALSETESPPALIPRLPEITVPTLIIWGKHDPLFPLPDAEHYLNIPNSTLVQIDEVGHLPHEESPDEVNRLILEFLKEH